MALLQSMQEMIDNSKAIADDANKIAELAKVISEQCTNKT